MEKLLLELESKIKDHKNTNTIFDTRKYVLYEDAQEILNKALALLSVSCTFKDKVKKDIEELEQDLQELEQDLEFAYTDIEGWSYKTSIVKGAINALVKTLNYS